MIYGWEAFTFPGAPGKIISSPRNKPLFKNRHLIAVSSGILLNSERGQSQHCKLDF